MNCNTTHYRANSSSVPGDPTGLKLCTLIEHWLVCPMHVLWKYDEAVCTKPDCIRCQLKGRRPPQWWRYTGLMRRATKHIDAFVGPSLFTMNMHRERGLRGTMVQLPLFHPEPPPVAKVDSPIGDKPYFFFAGRLEKIKGVQNVIPVFRQHADLNLIIAGDGNFENDLRRLADGAPNIHFLGRVNTQTLQSLYKGAIATLVPSLCYETFGVVVAESYSAGTPVVVFAQSSLQEIVETHGGGLLYRTPEELMDCLKKLAGDAELRQRHAQQGRAAYDAEFAERPFLTHYLDVVHELRRRKQSGESRDSLRSAGATLLAGRQVSFA